MSDVDVAAIREALKKATPGPWEAFDLNEATHEVGQPWWWVWRTEAKPYYGGVFETQKPSGKPRDALSDAHGIASAEATDGDNSDREHADAELIALLRNNAEALLDAAERWHRYCEAFEVKPPASSLRPMRTTSNIAEPDWSNGVHP